MKIDEINEPHLGRSDTGLLKPQAVVWSRTEYQV